MQLALVGAPNVGKSSLVQILSSGVPEICDYPFTTRSIKMGHFYVDSQRHQVPPIPGGAHAGPCYEYLPWSCTWPAAWVCASTPDINALYKLRTPLLHSQAGAHNASTVQHCRSTSPARPLERRRLWHLDNRWGLPLQVTDTPGLLNREEEDRNAMERLTLACMAHLPSSVLFIMDLTGQCGTSVAAQWDIRRDLRQAFPASPWLDVFTKADLLADLQHQMAQEQEQLAQHAQEPHFFDSLASASADERHIGGDGSSGSSSSSSEASSLPQSAPRDADDASAGSGGSQAHSLGTTPDAEQQQNPSEAGEGLSGSRQGQRTRFKWGDRADNNTEKALEVARALPQAIWVSSLTEFGLSDLKGSVLQLLAKDDGGSLGLS